MADLAPFPDVEQAVISLLTGLGTADTETPSNLVANLPFIRVNRIGGTNDRITDAARVDVNIYAVKRTDAATLAETVRQRMLSYPHVITIPVACVLDDVITDVAPNEVPWGDPAIRRFTSSYRVTARR